MPIYEYYCASCKQNFEEIVFDNQTPPCPKCDGNNVEKLISRPCRHHNGDGGGNSDYSSPAPSGGGGCGGCSGGNCASCK